MVPCGYLAGATDETLKLTKQKYLIQFPASNSGRLNNNCSALCWAFLNTQLKIRKVRLTIVSFT